MFQKTEIVCLKSLGKGPFFDEYLITLNKKKVKCPKFYLRAMKKSMIALNRTDESIIMIELAIRSAIRHPFLINQICAFQDYDNLYYISEHGPVKLLRSKLLPKKFSLEMVKFYSAEIFSCLKYLHEKKQNYTYLSPQNVLIGIDGHIKLNYNFCNCIELTTEDMIGQVEYSSYDYVQNNRFSYLSDYWSLGVLIYEMFSGYSPFTDSCLSLTVIEMKKCEFYISDTIDPVARSFISMLIDRNLENNFPTCESLEYAIENHPFFQNIDFNKVFKKEYEPPFIFNFPEYNMDTSPTLDVLYTTDFMGSDFKDGYGRVFEKYNSSDYLVNKKGFMNN